MNRALEKLGSKPENSIMLGDTMFDIMCARNAGVRSVLVAWSIAVNADDDLGDKAPDYIIHRPEELLEII